MLSRTRASSHSFLECGRNARKAEGRGATRTNVSRCVHQIGRQLTPRVTLADIYKALPAYGSVEFWSSIEEPDLKLAVPLEVLVKCIRAAIACRDDAGRNRIITVIIRRTQTSNEYWAYRVLGNVRVQPGERSLLVHDLYR
jgi:hypothetical protein